MSGLITSPNTPSPEIFAAAERFLKCILSQNPNLAPALLKGFSISVHTPAGLAYQVQGGMQVNATPPTNLFPFTKKAGPN